MWLNGKNPASVTDKDVEILFVQVSKFRLSPLVRDSTLEKMEENESTFPHFDINIEPENVEDTFQQIISDIRPLWDKQDVIFKTVPKGVSNGLLNTMIKCYSQTDKMDVIMIRIHNIKVNNWLDRSIEVKCIKVLDCAPKILATFETGFCYEYYHGEILNHTRLKKNPIWRLIAVDLAKFHSTDLNGVSKEESVKKLEGQIDSLMNGYPQKLQDPIQDEIFKREIPPLEELKVLVDELKKQCGELNSPIVLCHNDTRAENIVWNPEKQRIHFVDFEAMNYGFQANELASHFARYSGMAPPDYNLIPNEAFQMDFLRFYLEQFYTFSGKNAADVTEKDVRTLYVQVNKYYLFQLVMTAIAIPVFDSMNILQDSSFNLVEFAVISMKEYYKQRDKILAMTLPD
uniref:ethanolamine kinase n=1 Tax=Strigamia maritima TaxID=126957 RepID=T1J440_STRMM